MNYNINLLERTILESLSDKSKNLEGLQKCTAFNKEIVINLLESLLSKNLVIIKNYQYCLNKNINKEIQKELKETTNIKIELNEIINAIYDLKQLNQAQFHLKKFHLSEREEKIFNGLLYNLESFINSLKDTKQPTSHKKIFIWGGAKYEDINKQYINF